MKRTKSLRVPLTVAESEALDAAARGAGRTPTDWARRALLDLAGASPAPDGRAGRKSPRRVQPIAQPPLETGPVVARETLAGIPRVVISDSSPEPLEPAGIGGAGHAGVGRAWFPAPVPK